MRRFVAAVLLWVVAAGWPEPIFPAVALPGREDSVKFAVMGDTGTGDQAQLEVGQQMASSRGRFAFDLVLMLGDNMYGRQQRQDFVTKFERPYAALLEAGVTF